MPKVNVLYYLNFGNPNDGETDFLLNDAAENILGLESGSVNPLWIYWLSFCWEAIIRPVVRRNLPDIYSDTFWTPNKELRGVLETFLINIPATPEIPIVLKSIYMNEIAKSLLDGPFTPINFIISDNKELFQIAVNFYEMDKVRESRLIGVRNSINTILNQIY